MAIFRSIFRSRFWRRRHVILSAIALFLIVVLAVNALSSSSHETPPSVQKPRLRAEHSPEVHLRDDSLPAIPAIRSVHLDLKGAPPKIEFFAQLFPLLRSLGANCLLLEYEDMFPFEGVLKSVRAGNAYSKSDVIRLLSLAEQNSLQVIPLIQTFGHLEFALKLESFAHIREVETMPQAICPLNNNSWPIITALVDQVMALHPKAKYLHIGCDEVFHLGVCPLCRLHDRERLFLNHVSRVSKYVVGQHRVIPIVWDDMLRQLSLEAIKESRIADIGVEPMIWTYVRDIYRFIPESQFLAYAQLFPYIWTASAFKGAFGETLTVPNIRMHLENNMAWLSAIKDQSKQFKSIRGIVVTGWQRYDHLAALCELLPSALPSLALSLLTLSSGEFSPKTAFRDFDERMHCPPHRDHFSDDADRALALIETSDPNLFSRAGDCQFAGSDVFRLMRSHAETIKQVTDYLYDVTEHKAWLTKYNVRHNISSPFRVDEALQEFSTVNYAITSLMRSAKEALSQVYDHFTVEEWIEENIYPHLLRMEALMNDSMALKRARYWPKRPLPVAEDLKRRLEYFH